MLAFMTTVNRRERVRRRTTDEILDAAGEIVARGEVLTLRAVASGIGLTAPALYRYVSSLDDLVDLLGARLYADLTTTLVAARDSVPAQPAPDAAAARLVAMAWAFRDWALSHRFEYGLLFANPLLGADRDCTGTEQGAELFGGVFSDVFVQLWRARPFTIPADDELDPDIRRQLEESEPGSSDPLPLGLRFVFLRQWSRLYGTVTLEAFGHLAWALADTGPLFRAMLADNAAELGIVDPLVDRNR